MTGQVAPHNHPGDALRARREALGLSREGLAYKSGVALKTIERLERCEGHPRRATIAVIESVLVEAEALAA